MAPTGSIDEICVNTIRTLCIDAVQKAKSGHPGTPMAMAPVVYTLWQDFLRFDPEDPIWPNRDRFVLSNGHASTLLYSMLHLTGVKSVDEKYERLGTPTVALDDLKRFRQLDSKCPGHPEYHWTSGVETTTGPLGQGIATSVGMAIAADWLARHFNRPDFPLFDYDVFALCGDGCMMEGVSSEAASVAGHLRLGNLCWIYDSNHITIEGNTALAFSEDVAGRFLAYGWHVQRVSWRTKDGYHEDVAALADAFAAARANTGQPSFIALRTIIAWPAPDAQNTGEAHGAALGAEEVAKTKRILGFSPEVNFPAEDEAVAHARKVAERGKKLHADWEESFAAWRGQNPDRAALLDRLSARRLPEGWTSVLPSFPPDAKGTATRRASGAVLNELVKVLPELWGGSETFRRFRPTRRASPAATRRLMC